MKGLAYAGLFFCMNPLCRCATSPPVGEKNYFHLWYFSPRWGECPKGVGGHYCQYAQPGECLKGVGGHYCHYAQPGECLEWRGGSLLPVRTFGGSALRARGVYNKKGRSETERPSIKVGDDLLSHNCSTIGAVGLNFSVRNGKRWNPDAIVT